MPHFSSETWYIIGAAACVAGLIAWALWRRHDRLRDEAGDEWARADRRSRLREEDEFTGELQRLKAERPLESVHTSAGEGALPTAEVRTQAMAALGADVAAGPVARATSQPPLYGWATRGDVRSDIPRFRATGPMSGRPDSGVSRELEVSDAITGQIVAVVPRDDDTGDPRASSLLRVAEEWRSDWHWIGGELHPPTGLVDALPEDDWLRQLLEQDLVAA